RMKAWMSAPRLWNSMPCALTNVSKSLVVARTTECPRRCSAMARATNGCTSPMVPMAAIAMRLPMHTSLDKWPPARSGRGRNSREGIGRTTRAPDQGQPGMPRPSSCRMHFRNSASCHAPVPWSTRARGIAAERRQLVQQPLLVVDGMAFLLEEPGNRLAQAGMADPMDGAGGGRDIAARQLVLALGAGLDRRQPVRQGEVDGLVVAELEMQERLLAGRAPVAPVEGVSADQAQGSRNRLVAVIGEHEDDAVGHGGREQ